MIPDEFVEKIKRGHVALVGQAPGKGDPTTPLMGRAGRRLSFLMGVGWPDEYVELFARVNLLDEYPGAREGKGDLFSVTDAREPAAEIVALIEAHGGGEVVLLGKNVAKAFGVVEADWLEMIDLTSKVRASIVPHPSGVNYWWNDKKNRRAAATHLRRVAARGRKTCQEKAS